MTRADEIIAYVEQWRELIDSWARGSLQIDWGADAPGFSVKLTRSDRVKGERKEKAS